MVKKRFKAEQIVLMLREAEVQLAKGMSVEEASRSLGIAPQSYYRWRKEHGGMKLDQTKRLKELEQENSRLKKWSQIYLWITLSLKRLPGETSKPGQETPGD